MTLRLPEALSNDSHVLMSRHVLTVNPVSMQSNLINSELIVRLLYYNEIFNNGCQAISITRIVLD